MDGLRRTGLWFLHRVCAELSEMKAVSYYVLSWFGFMAFTVGPGAIPVHSQTGYESRLTVDVDKLNKLIDRLYGLDSASSPGVTVIVVQDGNLITQRQYGMASLEHKVPFTADHVACLPYSEGREFLAMTAALMANDGLIDLHDCVRDFFPKLPEWSKPVTILDLIHHRSGFVDEWSVLLLMQGSMANRFDRSQFLRLLYDQPVPEIEPGTGYMYSNSDYGLLRLILEQAAGQPLSDYMEGRIFKPLQMHSTHLVDDFLQVIPNHAPFYAPDGEGYRHQELKTSPGGNYVIGTTANDLTRWAAAVSDPSSELGKAIARLKTNAKPLPGRAGHYAFGQTMLQVAGHDVIRHEGVLECCYLTRLPALGLSIVTFGNRHYEPEKNPAILNFLLGRTEELQLKPFPKKAVPASQEQLARYSGSYMSTSIPSWESRTKARELIQINLTGDGLELDRPSWGRFPLVPLGDGTFSHHEDSESYPVGMLLSFGNPDPDEPLKLSIQYNDGYPAEEFVRPKRWEPSPELLRQLAGRYHSPHLNYTWTLSVDSNEKLVLRAPTLREVEVEPFQEHEFLLRLEKFPRLPFHVWVKFHQGTSGDISHLTVWNPRLMHHRFDRQ